MGSIEILGALITGVLACGLAERPEMLNPAPDTLRLVGSPISLGAAPSAAVAGDLTGDGQPDLLITNTDDGTLTLLVGDGSGGVVGGGWVGAVVGVGGGGVAVGYRVAVGGGVGSRVGV